MDNGIVIVKKENSYNVETDGVVWAQNLTEEEMMKVVQKLVELS